METSASTPRRGRPRSITRERIAAAGMEMGLTKLTFVGVAARLGVSHMALYKHVPNLEALKRLVAEEIFCRWQMPESAGPPQDSLESYLRLFSASLRELVRRHQGLAPYLIRRRATTPGMMARIYAHQEWAACRYGLTQERSRWLLSTVAFHCIALADTVYAELDADEAAAQETGAGGTGAEAAGEEVATIESEFDRGMQALICGVLQML
ncbi:TetR/AcrR family transcriptional regulator [Kerstersia sp.]|uniref:TetR/AcrR family transcriptional regulator n=1 Tax=Kerstersia sp. TaxID=1930783 RepID=UPI003F9120C1